MNTNDSFGDQLIRWGKHDITRMWPRRHTSYGRYYIRRRIADIRKIQQQRRLEAMGFRTLEDNGEGQVYEVVRKVPWFRWLRDHQPYPGPMYIGGSALYGAVWDSLYGTTPKPLKDIDVVFFDPELPESEDQKLTDALRAAVPGPWTVINQAWVHLKFTNRPRYTSLGDAVSNYCERSACVVARLLPNDRVDVIAPYGIYDLVNGIVRPSKPEYAAEVVRRVLRKEWLKRWPKLRLQGLHETTAGL